MPLRYVLAAAAVSADILAPHRSYFAERMGATIVHVPASHVAMLSQPEAVAEAILAAAGAD